MQIFYLQATQITISIGPTWSTPGSCRPQVSPRWAPWTLLSGYSVLILQIIWNNKFYCMANVKSHEPTWHQLPQMTRMIADIQAPVGTNPSANTTLTWRKLTTAFYVPHVTTIENKFGLEKQEGQNPYCFYVTDGSVSSQAYWHNTQCLLYWDILRPQ